MCVPPPTLSILDTLEKRFPDRIAITRKEFRDLLGISIATDARLKRDGNYPPLFLFPFSKNSRHEGRILLTCLADWLSSNQYQSQVRDPHTFSNSGKKRGRPVGSKNKPKIEETFTF